RFHAHPQSRPRAALFLGRLCACLQWLIVQALQTSSPARAFAASLRNDILENPGIPGDLRVVSRQMVKLTQRNPMRGRNRSEVKKLSKYDQF
ncbi:MAG: hypothetical protein IKU14_00650, partial [Rhodocyclaceae bacterium]|nr:hypothetical protein [Rhodocyclaceae bacterium]